MIASAEARTYLNQVTIERMIQALCDGARATGVAINELTPSILEGRLANTFAIWHNISLQTVGLFDLTADMPHDLRFADFKRGWHEKVGVVHYHTAGVEEVIPLARMVVIFGACIAPVLPCQDDGQEVHYEEPDPATQPELYQRHVSKMGTKLERQTAHLAQVKCDITYLKGGVMKKYRRF
jgi:hypothetical protein